ncbi:ATP-binding protein [Nocardia terpenica]|uniref:Tetratricopeptide repeat protein n=1 Tax=Nocardia terpenica TaxID=455432 RepID=A0A6G9Z3W6_9NOCA|nr:tetratricopeptide repeat protein [Nocardia terpenica]QIS20279.1 tetratricopeptide repeat protein [Nocardia terpenica]
MPEFEARGHAQQVNVGGDNTGVINATTHHHYEAARPAGESITTSLPATPRVFVGRDRELRQILDAADRERVVSIHAIDGMAGVGKTALAVRAAHELAARFPDGQYFVELHAHTPEHKAADPSDALAGLLIELGMDPRNIPDTLTGRRDLWRNRLGGKKALLVLDDAADRDQIEPLLPSGPECLTLVTSRHRLRVLPGTRPLPLKVLDLDPAANLFLSVAGRDSTDDGERDVAQRIAGLCGRLPLAVVLVAGRVAHHPHWTTAEITELAAEFEAATDRLTALDADDRIVRVAFDLSYRDLPPQRQMLFRRLGLHPGPDIDAYVAMALTGVDLDTAKRELEVLFVDHLLDEPARGRYRLHDLLRDYARILTTADPTADNVQAVDRLLDYYQNTAAMADLRLARQSRPTTIDTSSAVVADGVVVRGFTDEIRALAWMRGERANLLACLNYATGDASATRMVALTDVIAGLLQRDGPWPLARHLHQRAAAEAECLGDRLSHANALTNFGVIQWRIGDHKQATDLYQRALDLYREIGNRLGEANSLMNLGLVHEWTGDYQRATDLYQQALDLYRGIGNRLGEANTLMNLGLVCQLTGDYRQATDLHQQALSLYREIGYRLGEATALGNLGLVCKETGDYEQAADLHQQALALHREIGNRLGQGIALGNLASVRRQTGDYEQAADLHLQSLAIDREIGDRYGEAVTLNNLGLVRRQTGDYEQAADLHQQALGLYREIGNRLGQATALGNLASVRVQIGDYIQAADLYRQSLTLHREIGYRLGEALTLNEIGTVSFTTGKPDEALTAFTDALGVAREIGSHFEQARALGGVARCRASLGDIPAAVASMRAAVEIFQHLGVPEADTAATHLAELESRQSSD